MSDEANRPNGPFMLIDPPGPWDPLEDWQAFLADMQDVEKKHPGHAQAVEMIAEAKREIAWIEAGRPPLDQGDEPSLW